MQTLDFYWQQLENLDLEKKLLNLKSKRENIFACTEEEFLEIAAPLIDILKSDALNKLEKIQNDIGNKDWLTEFANPIVSLQDHFKIPVKIKKLSVIETKEEENNLKISDEIKNVNSDILLKIGSPVQYLEQLIAAHPNMKKHFKEYLDNKNSKRNFYANETILKLKDFFNTLSITNDFEIILTNVLNEINELVEVGNNKNKGNNKNFNKLKLI